MLGGYLSGAGVDGLLKKINGSMDGAERRGLFGALFFMARTGPRIVRTATRNGDRLVQAPFPGLRYLPLNFLGFLPVGEKVRAYGERKDECRDCRC